MADPALPRSDAAPCPALARRASAVRSAWRRACVLLLLTAAAAAPSPAPALAASASDQKVGALEAALLHAPDADHADILQAKLADARMAALSPTTRLLVRRAQRELDTNQGQDAFADASDAIALEPDRAVLWRERASIEGAMGDADAAVRDLGGALSRDPADLESWAGLAAVAEKTGRYDRAVEAWQHVLLLAPAYRNGVARLHALQRKARGEPT
ncbi:tetratricopeptide repeat protein [Acetobacteraceae bacterium KSS8]|uniref:Tetratricopeptide repeat protein n=1 Tax=Endosaccharibacter trunci TaxID=2812733 RepID=A0ABT1W822_9PROT|nr:tetratricopeptide repeat protein [Acetobacteraceae bacterium KSS8]